MVSRVGIVLLIIYIVGYLCALHSKYDNSQPETCQEPVMYHRLGVGPIMKESNDSLVNAASHPQQFTTFQSKPIIPLSTDSGKALLSYPLFKPSISLPFSTPFSI